MPGDAGRTDPRAYRMRKRADDVSKTRQRIVEAAAHLHGTIGPAATTVSALAEAAGVTRLTVYRHFPDEETLFAACSRHWSSQQVMPDPQSWDRIHDPTQRLRAGLADLYRFYRHAEPMLSNVRRDADAVPAAIRGRNAANDALLRNTLLQPFPVAGVARRKLRAVLGHAMSFSTWHSLCVEQRLSNSAAVSAMSALVETTAGAATAASAARSSRERS